MLSDLQLVYMGPRNSTELLKINPTKFQVEREPVYIIIVYYALYIFLYTSNKIHLCRSNILECVLSHHSLRHFDYQSYLITYDLLM